MLTIKTVSKESIPLIRDLTFQVWPQTYRGLLSEEQIDYMLDLMYSEESLARQMDEGAQFLIAYDSGKPVGFASCQNLTQGIFKLHKIYILPSQQGKGTGRFLIDHILDTVQKNGGKVLHLQVNRNNSAKQFYEKLGFTAIEEIKLDIGKGFVMDDFIMEKTIAHSSSNQP